MGNMTLGAWQPRPGRPPKIKPDRIRALIAETAGITPRNSSSRRSEKDSASPTAGQLKRILRRLHVVQKVKINTRKQTRNRRKQKWQKETKRHFTPERIGLHHTAAGP